ncbi:MAG: patatin-like phospholipase family protein [Ignavibacteriaceae bacterium]
MQTGYLIKVIIFTFVVLISSLHPQQKKIISIELKPQKLPFGIVEYIPADKPKVGLALSGGGARAIAQIGVLKALEEAGIKTDIIVGTSMGSIIGGLFAAGYSFNELDSIVSKTDWESLLSLNNETSRSELFVDQKITEDRALFSLRLDGFKPVLPTSLNNGQRLSNYFYLLTSMAPINSGDNFDDLWVKFRAVCTDLISGQMVVLDKGSLSKTMRASSSVSFFLEPVQWGDQLLVDGGLVSNIPVDVTRQSGADLVIAVNTTSPLHSEEDMDLPWYVADQVVSIPMKKINDLELSRADFIITPELKNVAATEFTNIDSLILYGYLSTIPLVEKIKLKIDSIRTSRLKGDEYFIKNIDYVSTENSEVNALLNKYSKQDSISSLEIKEDIETLYETGNFKNVSAEISEQNGSSILRFNYQQNPIVMGVKTIGVKIGDKDAINSTLSNLIAKPINNWQVAKDISEVLKYYRSSGYLLANCYRISFDELTGELILYFDEGKISEIRVEGKFARETLVTREIPIHSGDYFTYAKAKQGLDNLRSSRFYSDISLSIEKEEGKNILVINVQERETSILRFGFLLNETYNAQFGLDIRDEDFLGTGIETGLYLFGGANNRQYIYELKNHRILDTYLTYNLSAFYKKTPYKTKIVSLGITATVDDIDRYPYPLKGLYFSGFYETAQSFLGGDEGYSNLGMDLLYYIKLGKRSTVVPRVKIGFGDKTLPLSEQFLLGGMNSFFGMRENEFRGRQIMLTSIMYRIKLPFQIFFDTYLKLRYDLGTTWLTQEKIRFKDLRHGIGGIISFDTPIGPAEFAIGRSFLLQKDLPENPIRWGDLLFYFSIGYQVSF